MEFASLVDKSLGVNFHQYHQERKGTNGSLITALVLGTVILLGVTLAGHFQLFAMSQEAFVGCCIGTSLVGLATMSKIFSICIVEKIFPPQVGPELEKVEGIETIEEAQEKIEEALKRYPFIDVVLADGREYIVASDGDNRDLYNVIPVVQLTPDQPQLGFEVPNNKIVFYRKDGLLQFVRGNETMPFVKHSEVMLFKEDDFLAVVVNCHNGIAYTETLSHAQEFAQLGINCYAAHGKYPNNHSLFVRENQKVLELFVASKEQNVKIPKALNEQALFIGEDNKLMSYSQKGASMLSATQLQELAKQVAKKEVVLMNAPYQTPLFSNLSDAAANLKGKVEVEKSCLFEVGKDEWYIAYSRGEKKEVGLLPVVVAAKNDGSDLPQIPYERSCYAKIGSEVYVCKNSGKELYSPQHSVDAKPLLVVEDTVYGLAMLQITDEGAAEIAQQLSRPGLPVLYAQGDEFRVVLTHSNQKDRKEFVVADEKSYVTHPTHEGEMALFLDGQRSLKLLYWQNASVQEAYVHEQEMIDRVVKYWETNVVHLAKPPTLEFIQKLIEVNGPNSCFYDEEGKTVSFFIKGAIFTHPIVEGSHKTVWNLQDGEHFVLLDSNKFYHVYKELGKSTVVDIKTTSHLDWLRNEAHTYLKNPTGSSDEAK